MSRSILVTAARFAAVVLLVLASTAAQAAPSASNISAPNAAELYDKYEVTFDISTVATNMYWPYDLNPPANVTEHPKAVPAGVGVSVDGLFLPPGETDWGRAKVQPGFYYQPMERKEIFLNPGVPSEWLQPVGAAQWKIRFAPTAVGTWSYRIRIVDQSGLYESTARSFNCTDAGRRGFVRASLTDPRYFETSDGRYLNLVGIEPTDGGSCIWDKEFPLLGEQGINFLRMWWNPTGNGPAVFGLTGYYARNWNNFRLASSEAVTPLPGRQTSAEIDGRNIDWDPANPLTFTYVFVEPRTRYRFSAWIKTVNLQAEAGGGVGLKAFSVEEGGGFLTPPMTGSRDWTQVSTTVTTKSAVEMMSAQIAVEKRTAGSVYFSDVSVREVLADGKLGPELVIRPHFDIYQYVPQHDAYAADYQVELARRHGIYLKVVLHEVLDWVYQGMQPDGTINLSNSNPGNFYGNATHASRTYLQYFWRYIIARYGYATSIHSFEMTNEGNPFGPHQPATGAMAKYFTEKDPNRHLITTSCWGSTFVSNDFWRWYPEIGYADWHQYVDHTPDLSPPEQSFAGWRTWYADTAGLGRKYVFATSTSEYRSAPNSGYITNTMDTSADEGTYYVYGISTHPLAISPQHRYRLSWSMKYRSLVPEPNYGKVEMNYLLNTGWDGGRVGFGTAYAETLSGTSSGWTQHSAEFTVPADGYYLVLTPLLKRTKGHLYLDDITLYDITAGRYVDLVNGDFDSPRLDHDSALMTYSVGSQVGSGAGRQLAKPVVRGNAGIAASGHPDPGYRTGEHPELIKDDRGIWYKKFLWGQVNHFGVVDVYYWTKNIMDKQLYTYAQAYQKFMADIPLANGHYVDAAAAVSSRSIRAWGQKEVDPTSKKVVRAHLWIDNIPYNWKNVVDGVLVPAATGTVAVDGFADGPYTVRWWNTSNGDVISTDNVNAVGGRITLNLTLPSDRTGGAYDVACKIDAAAAAAVATNLASSTHDVTPAGNGNPGDTVTMTVGYNNFGSVTKTLTFGVTLPAYLLYVENSAESSGGHYDPTTRRVEWTVHDVPAGESGSRTYQVRTPVP